MEKLYLGIDTSNYTTSLALCRNGQIIKSVRRLLPVKQGSCGLRQSDAVFLHTKALPELAKELFNDTGYLPENLAAVGVSVAPRNEKGSYMPCFLAGVSFANGIAGAMKLPLYSFSHQSGHIMAGIASCSHPAMFENNFLSFHVSGGTTEALYVKSCGAAFKETVVGGTLDASAGQIVDRAGVLAELAFPCGKELDALSYDLPKCKSLCVSMKGAYFSLSGLQNRFEKMLAEGKSLPESAAYLFDSIGETLARSLNSLRETYGELPALFAGGVMCNSRIRKRLAVLTNTYFADADLSSDNACGTALLCMREHIAHIHP